MGLLPNRVERPNRTLSLDDRTVDTIGYLDPASGLLTQKPVAASDEEKRQVEIDGLRRALASVDQRLATLDPGDVFPWETPMSAEEFEAKLAGLEAERA